MRLWPSSLADDGGVEDPSAAHPRHPRGLPSGGLRAGGPQCAGGFSVLSLGWLRLLQTCPLANRYPRKRGSLPQHLGSLPFRSLEGTFHRVSAGSLGGDPVGSLGLPGPVARAKGQVAQLGGRAFGVGPFRGGGGSHVPKLRDTRKKN